MTPRKFHASSTPTAPRNESQQGLEHASMKKRIVALAAAALTLTAIGGAGLWWKVMRHPVVQPQLVYTAQGYGGYVGPKKVGNIAPNPRPKIGETPRQNHRQMIDPVRSLQAAYRAGNYSEVAVAARKVIRGAQHAHSLGERRHAVQARQVLAYAYARQNNLKTAQSQFALLRQEAAALPDRGKQDRSLGADPQPTLEEEAAFQHAVCTGAVENHPAAEAEYRQFMQAYPESPLVQAAVKRIARFHDGNVSPADAAIWQQAMQIAKTRQKARVREASLCGPECLAEMLRRRGETADVHALAQEMDTSDQGTSLAALAQAAKRRGFASKGLALTAKGLTQQKLPLVALVNPNHFVIVEALTPEQITIWDPDARGVGKADRKSLPLTEWSRNWQGIALAL